jgi:hypothetical protein
MITAAHKAEWLRNNLKQGELYAGLILGQNGEQDYHLVLLPTEADGVTWKNAITWAKKAGGQLPTRRELRLLMANAADSFAKDWYWSGEQHAASSGYAWCQTFASGGQTNYRTFYKLRARAVRQIPIE